MRYLGKTILTGGAAAAALLLSDQAFAAPVSVDGISFSTGASFQIGEIYENAVTAPGQTLSGFGRIDSINGSAGFCAGGPASCELTFTFDSYTVKNYSKNNSQVNFSGGVVNFYADTNTNFDKGSRATAGDGSLFLSTIGHQFTDSVTGRQGTLLGQGINLKGKQIQGTGNGQLDVTGGDADAYFNTNTENDFQGGFSDLLFNSSFSRLACPPNGPVCGSGDIHANAQAPVVSEPSQVGLMGLGLVALGFFFGRRRRSL